MNDERFDVDVGSWEPGDRVSSYDPRDERPSRAELQQDQIEMEEFMRRWREHGPDLPPAA